jgi:hypothetical protein
MTQAEIRREAAEIASLVPDEGLRKAVELLIVSLVERAQLGCWREELV